MSHTAVISGVVKDQQLFIEICRKLGLEICSGDSHNLYSRNKKIQGIGVKLPGWNYPIIVQEDGAVAFDNYGGSWGDIKELHRALDEYNYSLLESESIAQGHSVTDTSDHEMKKMRVDTEAEGSFELEFSEGKVNVDANDFTGESCEEAAEYIHEALGGNQDIEYKDEYFIEKNVIDNKQIEGFNHCG